MKEPEIEAAEQIANIDDLLATADLESVYVALPAPFVGGVKIRPLTMQEVSAASKTAVRKVRGADGKIAEEIQVEVLNKQLVLLSLVEPAINPAQYDGLMQKKASLMTAILQAVTSVNALSPAAQEEVVAEAKAAF